MELNWFEICETGLVKFLESVRNEAIIPSVSVPVPVSPRFVAPVIAIYAPRTAIITYCT